MVEKITVYIGVAGVLLGWLVALAGCAGGGDGTTTPVTTPPEELAVVESEPGVEPQVAAPPTDEETTAQAEKVDETAAVAPEPAAGQGVSLLLKYVPGRTTRYKVTTEGERSVAWEGDTTNKPPAFRDGRTGQRIEITFEQTVEQVGSAGNAGLEVTIEALRFLGRVRDKVVLDFDSSRDADRQHPLARLIGQSYRIEMTPRGEMLALHDIDAARQATLGDATALRLLSDKAIEQRHQIPALKALKEAQVEPGREWNSIRAISFGILGSKAYDRIYTLQAVDPNDDGHLAVVEMEAIPPVTGAGQALPEQAANPFAATSDSTDNYTGRLRFDLDAGQVQDYVEQFRAEWRTVDPTSLQSGQAHPAVLRMGMQETYQLERLK